LVEDVMDTGLSSGTLAYAQPYETSERIFGVTLPAKELIDRVRSYDWRESLIRLADLASIASHARVDGNSERIRQRTIDSHTTLTGRNETLLRNARAAVAQRRDKMVLAHEEGILFLEHLVILEGGTSGPGPGDPEIALWLAGANSHLEQSWSEPDRTLRTLSRVLLRVLDRRLGVCRGHDLSGLAGELAGFHHSRKRMSAQRSRSRRLARHGVAGSAALQGTE
jgi:hypothetical protein